MNDIINYTQSSWMMKRNSWMNIWLFLVHLTRLRSCEESQFLHVTSIFNVEKSDVNFMRNIAYYPHIPFLSCYMAKHFIYKFNHIMRQTCGKSIKCGRCANKVYSSRMIHTRSTTTMFWMQCTDCTQTNKQTMEWTELLTLFRKLNVYLFYSMTV